MKYLNNYKLYESDESEKAFSKMLDDIDDMLYEITDYGFECEVEEGYVRAGVGFAGVATITINTTRLFGLQEIEDCLIRILDYSYTNNCRVEYSVNLQGKNGISYELNNKLIGYYGNCKIKHLSNEYSGYDECVRVVFISINQNVDSNN